MRIGHGYDVHAFEEGDGFVLGGVRIPFERGLKAHSDGDVLLHALCDALLGAAGLGDIGRHFPDSDAANENIDSRILLATCNRLLAEQGWAPANVDATIVLQRPRLSSYVGQMEHNIATDLDLLPSQVNVKATTTEGLGFTGRSEGIAAHAVVLLQEFVA